MSSSIVRDNMFPLALMAVLALGGLCTIDSSPSPSSNARRNCSLIQRFWFCQFFWKIVKMSWFVPIFGHFGGCPAFNLAWVKAMLKDMQTGGEKCLKEVCMKSWNSCSIFRACFQIHWVLQLLLDFRACYLQSEYKAIQTSLWLKPCLGLAIIQFALLTVCFPP